MAHKIIAVDLDGTLLNSQSQLSDFTKETIKKSLKKVIRSSLQLAAPTAWHTSTMKNWGWILL